MEYALVRNPDLPESPGTSPHVSREPRAKQLDNAAEPHRCREEQPAASADHCTAIALSLVIPAYNEAVRLPPYLDTIHGHFTEQLASQYEVIVVDDGSSDQLPEVLSEISLDWQQLRTIRHPQNKGKGAAVRTGILASFGQRILFADADGATPIEEECRLRQAIDAGADVAVGSRLIDAEGVVRSRTRNRAAIGHTFATMVHCLFSVSVTDTQCGFKMFRAEPGRRLLALSQENGYLFDIEVLALAEQLGYRVVEVPISWSDQPGSRMHMWRESPGILAGLWRVRRRLRRQLGDDDSQCPVIDQRRDEARR